MVPWMAAVETEAVEAAAVETLSKLFTDNGGDIAKLAAATGSDADLMDKNKPADADDFARKVLSGCYRSSTKRRASPMPKRRPSPNHGRIGYRRAGIYVRQAGGPHWWSTGNEKTVLNRSARQSRAMYMKDIRCDAAVADCLPGRWDSSSRRSSIDGVAANLSDFTPVSLMYFFTTA